MGRCCKCPLFPVKGCVKAKSYLWMRVLTVVLVVLINLVVTVKISIGSHDRTSLLIIELLVHIECIRGISCHMLLNSVANCARNATGIHTLVTVTVISGHLGDNLMVISAIEADLPREVTSLKNYIVEIKLNTCIHEGTDICVQIVLEVRQSGNRSIVKKGRCHTVVTIN